MYSQRVVNNYFLNGTGLRNVAVFSILSFGSKQVPFTFTGREFQAVIQNFLAAAKAAGKTKLIIDLQANPGGRITLGYDTFKQLFPNIDPLRRFRLPSPQWARFHRPRSQQPCKGRPSATQCRKPEQLNFRSQLPKRPRGQRRRLYILERTIRATTGTWR